jgi:hypothetical protein
LEDQRNVGESSCNYGDGTDQRVQSLMFIIIIIVRGILVSSLLRYKVHHWQSCYIGAPTKISSTKFLLFQSICMFCNLLGISLNVLFTSFYVHIL